MYNLEIDKAVKAIKAKKAKTVCIQLPEGLKPKAKEIVDKIESKTKARCLIWLGTCFGACDVPKAGCDLVIQWGHSRWIS